MVTLFDPDGFMGLYRDAYSAVAEAISTLGHHDRGTFYWDKPTPMGAQIQKQLESYGKRKMTDMARTRGLDAGRGPGPRGRRVEARLGGRASLAPPRFPRGQRPNVVAPRSPRSWKLD